MRIVGRKANGELEVIEEFKGIESYTGQTQRVALVRFEGDTDIYDVDDNVLLKDVIEEIRRRYYRDYLRGPESIRIMTHWCVSSGESEALEKIYKPQRDAAWLREEAKRQGVALPGMTIGDVLGSKS